MRFLRILLAAGLLNLGGVCPLCAAQTKGQSADEKSVSVPTILTDFFLVRPVALASLVTAVPIATLVLPFSALVGNSRSVSKELLGNPFHHTFRRHLGDFSED
jgi:hypothetical protein